MSKLKVNLSNGSFVVIGCLKEMIQSLARTACRNVGKLSILYLGLLIGAYAEVLGIVESSGEEFERQISICKRRCLSLGGRITLLKVCMSNMPVYYMSRFKMPKALEATLDQIRRNLLWEVQS